MIRRVVIAAMLCAGLCRAGDEWETAIGQLDQNTRGLVAYWAMRNSGTTVFDELAAYNGTAVNTPVFSTDNGAVNVGALFASASSEYITHAIAIPRTATTYSVSAWARFTDFTANRTVIDATEQTAFQSVIYRIIYLQASDQFQFFVRDEASSSISTVIARSGMTGWLHFVGVRDGNDCRFYINGVLVASQSGSVGALDTGAYFGTIGAVRNSTGPSNYQNGEIDEVRLYNVVKTAAEIHQLYRMGAIPRGIR